MIAAIVVALGHSLLLGILEAVTFGTEKLALNFLGFLIVMSVCNLAYNGYSWARWFFVIYFGVGSVWASVAAFKQPVPLVVLHGSLCLAAAGMLGAPRSVSAFLSQQRVARSAQANAKV